MEGGGGGQEKESYLLAWLIAARHTSIDCFDKRTNKGFLFTIGDEGCWDNISAGHLEKLMGYKNAETVSDKQLLKEAQRMYHVFHIHVQQGNYRNNDSIVGYWRNLLGENLIVMEDYKQICSVISGVVSGIMGANLDSVVSTLNDTTALIVRNTVLPVLKNLKTTNNQSIIIL